MKIVLSIAYDGFGYHGWQTQKNIVTVQETVEKALSRIADQPLTIHCAGRTDSGVHAENQIIHFETTAERPLDAWVLGGNSYLPDTISINWSHQTNDEFHARYSATARSYRYIIYNDRRRSALNFRQATHVYEPLDAHKMHSAAQHLIGEHDFSSFRAAGCQSNTPWRCIHNINVVRERNRVIIRVTANAFLHHMVRNIAGVLISIGSGKQSTEWTQELLAIKDRSKAAATALPNGLSLTEVSYPSTFNLPPPTEHLPC